MGWCCRIQLVWITNTMVVISLFAMIAIIHLDMVPFPKIGFSCQDPKLSYKFNGDTVTMGYLFGITLSIPCILVVSVEFLKSRTRAALKMSVTWYGQYTFGLLMLISILEVAKSTVCEPRPHFFDTCQPDKAINCSTGYITKYKCTNLNATPYQIKDSVRSFPSGHSAIGFYLSVFLIMFLHKRLPKNGMLLVPLVQCLSLMWAVFCASSRVTDRRHHWWDVAIGSMCGVCFALYTVTCLCSGFKDHVKSGECSSESSLGSGKTSTRRLLSSTSSDLPPDEKESRAVS